MKYPQPTLFNWHFPLVEERINEFRSEPDIQRLYDADGYSFLSRDAYKIDVQQDIFLQHTSEGKSHYYTVETLPWESILTFKSDGGWPAYYESKNLDELSDFTRHMHKCPGDILAGFQKETGCPYLILLRQRDGSLKMLGGRTRASLCLIYRMNPRALILNEALVAGDMITRIKSAYLSLVEDKMFFHFSKDTYSFIWNEAELIARGESTRDESIKRLATYCDSGDSIFLKSKLDIIQQKLIKYSGGEA